MTSTLSLPAGTRDGVRTCLRPLADFPRIGVKLSAGDQESGYLCHTKSNTIS